MHVVSDPSLVLISRTTVWVGVCMRKGTWKICLVGCFEMLYSKSMIWNSRLDTGRSSLPYFLSLKSCRGRVGILKWYSASSVGGRSAHKTMFFGALVISSSDSKMGDAWSTAMWEMNTASDKLIAACPIPPEMRQHSPTPILSSKITPAPLTFAYCGL